MKKLTLVLMTVCILFSNKLVAESNGGVILYCMRHIPLRPIQVWPKKISSMNKQEIMSMGSEKCSDTGLVASDYTIEGKKIIILCLVAELNNITNPPSGGYLVDDKEVFDMMMGPLNDGVTEQLKQKALEECKKQNPSAKFDSGLYGVYGEDATHSRPANK